MKLPAGFDKAKAARAISNTRELLQRVTLQGKEVPAFNDSLHFLHGLQQEVQKIDPQEGQENE